MATRMMLRIADIGTSPIGESSDLALQGTGNGENGVLIQDGINNTVGGEPFDPLRQSTGGGPGPASSLKTSGGHLLHVGSTVLEVLSYHWDAAAMFDFGDSSSSNASHPGSFVVNLPHSQAGAMFVDLAEGTSLGDIVLNSSTPGGQLRQSWRLEDARVVHYHADEDVDVETIPGVELAFGFDAIESTIVLHDDKTGNEIDRKISRWEIGGEGPVTVGGGPGPEESRSTGSGDLLYIGDNVLDVYEYGWSTGAAFDFGGPPRPPQSSPGEFVVVTDFFQGGGLFVDLAQGRSLGDIVLNSSSRTGQLRQSWRLENAQVVQYSWHGDGDAGAIPSVDLAFGFDAIESTIVLRDNQGNEVDRKISRWEIGGEAPVTVGGGPGPEESHSTGAGDLLYIGDSVLDVYEYSWGAGAAFDFGGQPSLFHTSPGEFLVVTDFFQGGGLFVDLAEGRSLGDIVLNSSKPDGQLLHSWRLENAQVVQYSWHEDGDTDAIPTVELAFGFDAIESTIVLLDDEGDEVDRAISRWEMGGESPVTVGGGPGPEESHSTGSGDLLYIGDNVLEVYEYGWSANATSGFGGQTEPALTSPGEFVVVTDLFQGGGLFVDLVEGRPLGDIVLNSSIRTGELLHSWRLENAQVVQYSWHGDGDSEAIPKVELAFGFDAIESTIVLWDEEGGDEVDREISRWEIGGEDPVTVGGGPGPEESRSTGAGDLLYIGDSVLEVFHYGWGVGAAFEFGGQPGAPPTFPSEFVVVTDLFQGGGLFVDLAQGRSLGDIVLNSSSRTGQLRQSWRLENTRVVQYSWHNEGGADAIPTVELAFGFDAIESTIVLQDNQGNEIDREVSRWELGGEDPVTVGGGPGPEESRSTGGGELLYIDDSVLDVYEYRWDAAAAYYFRDPSGPATTFPGEFVVVTDLFQGGGLFVDLVEGRPAG